jgi:hypothetical protein
MSQTTKPTPTPYAIHYWTKDPDLRCVVSRGMQDGIWYFQAPNCEEHIDIVARTEHLKTSRTYGDFQGCLIATIPVACGGKQEAIANARFIVRACNGVTRLREAAEELLTNARDTGECFVDKDHEKYDPANPEQMWTDWGRLQQAVEKYHQGENHGK